MSAGEGRRGGPPPPLLEARSLACERDGRRLFADLSFSIPPGGTLQVTGGNGSGKTTLLRILAGLFTDFDGEVERRADEAPLYLGHRPGVKSDLTVAENLTWLTGLRGARAEGRALADALDALGLAGWEDCRCGRLSEGQRRKVALAPLFLCADPLWILDEPFSALDAGGIELLREGMRAKAAAGGGVVFSSHRDAGPADGLRTLALGGAAPGGRGGG